jgi:hypothetical protein
LVKAFEFEDSGRKFFCTVETSRHMTLESWWWFRLDDEKMTRYAPFQESPDDTQQSVQDRVIAYYAELQAIKARPARDRTFWRKPNPPA